MKVLADQKTDRPALRLSLGLCVVSLEAPSPAAGPSRSASRPKGAGFFGTLSCRSQGLWGWMGSQWKVDDGGFSV